MYFLIELYIYYVKVCNTSIYHWFEIKLSTVIIFLSRIKKKDGSEKSEKSFFTIYFISIVSQIHVLKVCLMLQSWVWPLDSSVRHDVGRPCLRRWKTY